MLTNDWVYNSIVFGWAVRYAGYITANDGNESNLKAVKEMTDEGYSLAIFPEGTRSKDGSIGRFHKGAFMVADELNLPIVPVLLHGYDFTMSKHDYIVKNGRVTTKILPAILPDDASFGVGYKERTKKISSYFKSEFLDLRKELETSRYFYPRIKSNYDYRGPMVESYFKIKWLFERDNYDYYSQFITNEDRLLDAGCGYGYYSFFLHYKYPKLRIDAMDMDENKIAYASNGTEKTDRLNFYSGNIKDLDYSVYTKIFFNDVLHYLTEADLNVLVDRIFSNLKPTQEVFIRDGNEDDGNNHKTTKLTEIFSTTSGFNQTSNELFFLERTG
ncbi:MAG: 1-acyl-sn-glycerol-3-phosphate acyltransferase [Flavobacteriales bacterium]|nr:1-acyl-sn-glycerol-3-phosphate acyltransferase [Flavobacteriales bacterium]